MKIFSNQIKKNRWVLPGERVYALKKDRANTLSPVTLPFFLTRLTSRGVSSIAALLTLLSLAAMGIAIAYLVASGEASRANHLLSSKAFYVTQAGIEYAIKKIYEGNSEIVNPPGKAFGAGTFTVSRSGRTLTITSAVGNAIRVNKMDSPTEADCTTIDISNISLNNNNNQQGQHGGGNPNNTISGITFRKICLGQITIDKMQFSWVANNGERLNKIKIEATTVYDNPAGAVSGTLLDITDYIVTNTNTNTITAIDFDLTMSNKTVTMTLTMGDTTTKTVTFTTGN